MRDYEDYSKEELILERKRLQALKKEINGLVKETKKEIEKLNLLLEDADAYSFAIFKSEKKNLKKAKNMFKGQLEKIEFELQTVEALLKLG